MTTNTSHSSGDGVALSVSSELAKLLGRAADLQRSVDTWNRWYVFSLGLVIIAAIAVGVTNRFVIARQRQLSAIQDDLLRTKDQQLRSELSDKDRELRRELADKDRTVANDLLDKDVRIGEVTSLAANANERAAQLELEAATQRERAAKADVRAADAQAELLWLETRSLPRTVDRGVFLAALEGKPKAVVEIMYAKDDHDSWQVASALSGFLQTAKWEAKQPVPIPPGKGDEPAAWAFGGDFGVTVVYHWTRENFNEFVAGHPNPGAACIALREAIARAMGAEPALSSKPLNNPPEGALRIVVAPKR